MKRIWYQATPRTSFSRGMIEPIASAPAKHAHPLFFECCFPYVCLSRACLGKMMTFSGILLTEHCPA
jgi:hypothetical protein